MAIRGGGRPVQSFVSARLLGATRPSATSQLWLGHLLGEGDGETTTTPALNVYQLLHTSPVALEKRLLPSRLFVATAFTWPWWCRTPGSAFDSPHVARLDARCITVLECRCTFRCRAIPLYHLADLFPNPTVLQALRVWHVARNHMSWPGRCLPPRQTRYRAVFAHTDTRVPKQAFASCRSSSTKSIASLERRPSCYTVHQ